MDLGDYIEIFKENHVKGNVLFQITESDLKDTFKMTSFGHRKNFMKAVENLKKMYGDHPNQNNEYLRKKIKGFFERNKHRLKSGILNGLGSIDGRFYSHRRTSVHKYHSTAEAIQEEEDFEEHTKNEDSPKLNGIGSPKSKGSGRSNSKRGSVDHGRRSPEEDERGKNKNDSPDSKKFAEDWMSPKIQGQKGSIAPDDTFVLDSPGHKEEKKDNDKEKEKKEGKNGERVGSDVTTSTSSDSSGESSDDEKKKAEELKENISEKIEIKDLKIKKSNRSTTNKGGSMVFKSNDNAPISKPDSKKTGERQRKR